MRAYVLVFLGVFVAELGDKTQLATVLFATDASLSRIGVVLAAAGALVASTVLAVVLGTALAAWIEPRILTRVAALGFMAIGVWMLVRG
jgi:putative Ca2+/H+ antiporter (TMEM165/GDT1 family)